MQKKYVFHYNGDLADTHEEVEPGEMTYHEHLMAEDGKYCYASMESSPTDRVEAYFDDGNELTVWKSELKEAVKRKCEIVFTMNAAMSYEVEAASRNEAEEKAQAFIDSEDFFHVVREKCDFFSPEVYIIKFK